MKYRCINDNYRWKYNSDTASVWRTKYSRFVTKAFINYSPMYKHIAISFLLQRHNAIAFVTVWPSCMLQQSSVHCSSIVSPRIKRFWNSMLSCRCRTSHMLRRLEALIKFDLKVLDQLTPLEPRRLIFLSAHVLHASRSNSSYLEKPPCSAAVPPQKTHCRCPSVCASLKCNSAWIFEGIHV